MNDEYTSYVTFKQGEVIGNNVVQKGEEDTLCVYSITKFLPESVHQTGDDTLLDLFIFSIMAVDALVGGQFILINAEARMHKYAAEHNEEIMNIAMPHKFMVNARLLGMDMWIPCGGAATETGGRIILQSWMDYIKPNQDLFININKEKAQFWNARSGFKIFNYAQPEIDSFHSKFILN